MMRAKQDISLDWIRGRVHGHFINRETGELRNEFEIKNVTTYAAADRIAERRIAAVQGLKTTYR